MNKKCWYSIMIISQRKGLGVILSVTSCLKYFAKQKL